MLLPTGSDCSVGFDVALPTFFSRSNEERARCNDDRQLRADKRYAAESTRINQGRDTVRIPPSSFAVALLALVMLVGACSDTVSDKAIEDTLARCESVPQATLDLIETGITIDNAVLSNGAAVKSDYGPTLWIIGAQFNGDGFEGDRFIGVWAVVDGKEASEITGIAGTDDFTRGISTWGEDLGNDLSGLIDGVSAATACVTADQQG